MNRKSMLLALLMVLLSGAVYAEEMKSEESNGSNPIAIGVEKVTKAPMTVLKGGEENKDKGAYQPVSDVVDALDHGRAAVVSAGLNAGKAVEE